MRAPWRWIALFVAAKLAITLAFADRYGWHRDELYYVASSRHLDFGYADYPPLVPLLAAADQALAPGSLVALRVLPAVAGAIVIVLCGLIARELGASPRAQTFAALSALLSPIALGGTLMFQTVAFDELVWAVALLVVVRQVRDGNQRLWPVFGLVIGIGLETKFTVAALPAMLLLALLVSPRRSMLASPWLWAGAAIALLLFVPNLVWQSTHDWISVQYALSHRGHTDGPVAYWVQQLLLFSPLLIPPAVAGMVALRGDARFVPLVYLAIGVELFFFAVGGKSYYAAPIYPLLYAAGAIWLDERLRSPTLVAVLASVLVAFTVVILPLGLPVLPAQTMVSLNIHNLRKDYANMIGWPELVQQTAIAYASLTPDERSNSAIIGQNYGEAGAIDLYGPAMRLPQALSPHLTFWYWAPKDLNPTTVVLIGFSSEFGNRYFADCRQAATISNDLGVHNEEYGLPILVCSNPRQPLWKVWRDLQTLD